MIQNNEKLQELLDELRCKTKVEDIAPAEKTTIMKFLRQEQQTRQHYRLERLLRNSRMKKQQIRTFSDFDWLFHPKTPKQDLLAFKNASWIKEAANLVLIGETGIGKSHLAKALCYEAILRGHSTYFITTFDLVSKIKKSPFPPSRIDHFGKAIDVLCLDELGYTYHQKEDTDLIFQIISKRTEVLPTIITTNLTPKKWGSIFSGPAASAILDRLSFNGKFLTWEEPSYRRKMKKK